MPVCCGARGRLHWRIGQALEAKYPEHARVEPEVVAHHYTQAGRVLEAAGYWAAAAHRSLDRSANVEALGHASKGLELLGSIVQTPQRDRLELDLEIVRGTAYRAVKGFASGSGAQLCTRERDMHAARRHSAAD